MHIILLTETWIHNENQTLQLQIVNYTHYYNYRTDSRGGGVSAYTHNDLKHNLSESIYQDGNNYLWVQIDKLALDIGVVYNPGNTNLERFLDDYEAQLQQPKRAIVFGDFNIDLLTKNKTLKKYKQIVNESGYKILNKIKKTFCTRESVTKKSIIDHVSTNLKDQQYDITIINSSMSDHKHIYVQIKKIKPPPKVRLNYENINYKKLFASMELCGTETNNYFELENKIKQCLEDSKVLKTKILNPPQNDWVNNDILTGISERNHLWIQHKNDQGNQVLENNYKEMKERIAKLIQTTKNSYYYKLFTNCSKNPKKTWSLINNLANNKIKQNGTPTKLLIDSNIVTNSNEICEVFNNYFSIIGRVLADSIPKKKL